MTTINLTTLDQMLVVAMKPKIASGDQNSVLLHVDFDAEWDGYAKSGVFFTEKNKTVYEMIMTAGECTVPHEVLAESGILYIGVRGVNSDNNTVKTSDLVRYRIEDGAPVGDGTTVDPTPDVYQRLLTAYGVLDSRVNELVAMRSTTGSTVYEIHFSVLSFAGRIYSNGASAYIEITQNHDPANAGLIGAGTGVYQQSCIPPELVPMLLSTKGNIELETDNPAMVATMSINRITGWGHLQIMNVSSKPFTNDMKATFSLHYALASVSISELADARIDVDGKRHATAGNAIRSQVSSLRNTAAPIIVNTKTGSYIETTDATGNHQIQCLRLFGKSTQNGTPTPDAPVSVRYPNSVEIFIAPVSTGEPSLAEPFASFDYQMAGIPMQDACTNHNFTDKYGQKWYTDEINLDRGVYIQRCFALTFDGTEDWYMEGNAAHFHIDTRSISALKNFESDGTNQQCYHMCSHYLSVPRRNRANGTVNSYGGAYGSVLQFWEESLSGDLDGWKAWLAAQAAAGTPMTMVLGMKTPEEVLLTNTQMPVIDQNYFVDNFAGFDGGKLNMELCYAVDTKKYIDQKLAEISAAILNN